MLLWNTVWKALPYNTDNLQNTIQNLPVYLWVHIALSHSLQLDCTLSEGRANFTETLRGSEPTLSLCPTPAEVPDILLQTEECRSYECSKHSLILSRMVMVTFTVMSPLRSWPSTVRAWLTHKWLICVASGKLLNVAGAEPALFVSVGEREQAFLTADKLRGRPWTQSM